MDYLNLMGLFNIRYEKIDVLYIVWKRFKLMKVNNLFNLDI